MAEHRYIPDLLTPLERETLAQLGTIAVRIRQIGASAGAPRMIHVHVLQRMIGAQAAARAYPDEYRLLGRTLKAADHG